MKPLAVSGLSVARGGRILIDGLHFKLPAGHICAVLGPNGAGKSSLLLALAGMIPARGEITLAGRSLASLGRAGIVERLAWQGELPSVEFGLTVCQRLSLAAGAYAAEAIHSCAARMEVDALLDRPMGELSAGERQRAELAALMLRDVPVWLLDEPTAHLDLRHQVSCMRMLHAQREMGRSVLVVLHDLSQALAVADSTIVVDGQGVAEYGDADLLDSERLSRLYGTPLRQLEGGVVPDYRVPDDGEAR